MTKTTFPSLTGVIRFLIRKHSNNKHKNRKVSVPYRGYSFFNIAENINSLGLSEFPSLTGVIRFLIYVTDVFTSIPVNDSFRPLQGLFVF